METVIQNERFKLVRFELGPYHTNSYVVTCEETRSSLVIDAPGDPEKIIEALEGTIPVCILMTHAHLDHYGALAELASKLLLPVAGHPLDAGSLPVPVTLLVQDGEIMELGALKLHVLHTPGHTPGSLCFLLEDILLSGDTLFPGGPGRTDSPADFERITESLRWKIFVLPDTIRVFPGHGAPTSLYRERPLFERFAACGKVSGLCGDVVWESC